MGAVYHMTYLQAVVIGLIQGVTELFLISSLGHTVLVPAWIGGTWGTMVRQESSSESPYLSFVVGLHLATALVLLGFYIKTWVRVIRGLITSIVTRRVTSADQRLAWLLVLATIPVGIAGLVLEHPFRVLFAKPLAAPRDREIHCAKCGHLNENRPVTCETCDEPVGPEAQVRRRRVPGAGHDLRGPPQGDDPPRGLGQGPRDRRQAPSATSRSRRSTSATSR